MKFWIGSTNYTVLDELTDRDTELLLEDDDVESVVGVLYDSSGVQVGENIVFAFKSSGKWAAGWLRTLTPRELYRMEITVLGIGVQLLVVLVLTADYKGGS